MSPDHPTPILDNNQYHIETHSLDRREGKGCQAVVRKSPSNSNQRRAHSDEISEHHVVTTTTNTIAVIDILSSASSLSLVIVSHWSFPPTEYLSLSLTTGLRHLIFVIPPILLLGYLYGPLFGRRDGIKVGWLMFMASTHCCLSPSLL